MLKYYALLLLFIQELGAFVGSVGLAGGVPGLYSINGSNRGLVEKLVEDSRCNIFL